MKRVVICMFAAMCLASTAVKADPADTATTPPTPDSTGAFTAYCGVDGHAKECRARVENVENSNLLAPLNPGRREPAAKTCHMPRAGTQANFDAFAERVVGWLAARPDLNAEVTDDAVTKAIVALWPC
jgi:hypothetical protein